MTYHDIVCSFQNNPRDVHTVPTTNREPRWFYTYVDDGVVYVSNAREHENSSEISKPRRIEPNQFDVMLDLYQKRCAGEAVSQLAASVTVCQVYWYGIFVEIEK